MFALTSVDTTHFSLADAITGATIDGSTLGVSGLAAAATLNRVLDIVAPWSTTGITDNSLRLGCRRSCKAVLASRCYAAADPDG